MFGEITAKIGGKDRVLKFNLNANYEFCKMHNLTQDEVLPFFNDGHNVTAIRDMIYCALKVADLEMRNPVDYNEYTVGEWIQEMQQPELERIIMGNADASPVIDVKVKKKEKA